MKKFGLIIMTILCMTIFVGCDQTKDNSQYLRLHIRANSNDYIDQEVKYKVRDKVVDYITPLIANCTSKQQMQNVVRQNFNNINAVCDDILSENGFDYHANTKLNNEFFPTRTYGDLTLQEGYYDAIIIELGQAKGDNWWCVVYPPLCFVNAKEINGKNFRYKSKIMELINKFFK